MEVIEALRNCDFVVDQVYYDVAISYVATEAAFLGKPSVIGSYAWEELACGGGRDRSAAGLCMRAGKNRGSRRKIIDRRPVARGLGAARAGICPTALRSETGRVKGI